MKMKVMEMKVISKENNEYIVEMNKTTSPKITIPCYWIPILVLVVLIILGIVLIIMACKSADLKCFVFIAVLMATIITLTLIILESLKQFAKMQFLKDLTESNSEDVSLTKKYCDTLAEL